VLLVLADLRPSPSGNRLLSSGQRFKTKSQQRECENCFFRRLAHVFEKCCRYFSKALKATVVQPRELGVQMETAGGRCQLQEAMPTCLNPRCELVPSGGKGFPGPWVLSLPSKKKAVTLGSEAARAKSLPSLQLMIFRTNTFCR